MKILEIVFKNPRDHPGGVESISSILKKCLINDGIEVETIFQIYSKPLRPFNFPDGSVGLGTFLPDSNLLLPINKLLFNISLVFYVFFHRKKFDVVHVNGDAGSLVTAIPHLKTLVTLHGSSRQTYTKISNNYSGIKRVFLFLTHQLSFIMERFAIQNGTEIVTVSQQVMNDFKQYINKTNLKVIYNGIDTDSFKPSQDKCVLRQFLGLDESAPLAVWVGKNALRKGLNDAVKAIECTKSFKLVVIGIESSVNNQNERIMHFGVIDNEKLQMLYSSGDVFLFPSSYEGFSVAVLEAMSSGLVPIIYRSNSSSEILNNGNDSFLADNTEEFGSELTYLENNREIMKKMGENARKKAILFSSDIFCRNYLQEIEKLKILRK